jgi:acylphosphatase
MPDVRSCDDGEQAVRLTARVDGQVQGVGFRSWVRHKAAELGLAGSATNLDDGKVEVVAEGAESGCLRLLAELESGAAPGRVTRVTQRWDAPQGDFSGFVER